MEIIFSDDDLARVRVCRGLSVALELMYAGHRWRAPHRLDVLGGWSRRTMTELGPLAAPVLADVQAGAFQFHTLGMDRGAQAPLDDVLDESLSRPTLQWRELIAEGLSVLRFPIQDGLAEGRAAAMTSAAESLRVFHRVAVQPYWSQLEAAAAAQTATWTHILATRGLAALLEELHPTVTWHQPSLSVQLRAPRDCDPSCFHCASHITKLHVGRWRVSRDGLTIMPTAFGGPWCGWSGHPEPGRGLVIDQLLVPIPITWQCFELNPSGPEGDALADLLGPTRSWVLLACLDGTLTTTKLAQQVGISNSSASEHAAVLRAAGLVQSERRGNRMLHRATPMGAALARSSTTRGSPPGSRTLPWFLP